MKITKEVIDTANAYFLKLDELAFLWSTYFAEDWEIDLSAASESKLLKLGMIDSKKRVTNAGESIVLMVLDIPEVEDSTEDVLTAFEAFWKLYPRDDAYNMYPRTRQLRWNKNETRKMFVELCKDYPPDIIIGALSKEIHFRKAPSTENLLKYMCNSVNWFKKGAFETFLDSEDDNLEDEYGKKIG